MSPLDLVTWVAAGTGSVVMVGIAIAVIAGVVKGIKQGKKKDNGTRIL